MTLHCDVSIKQKWNSEETHILQLPIEVTRILKTLYP